LESFAPLRIEFLSTFALPEMGEKGGRGKMALRVFRPQPDAPWPKASGRGKEKRDDGEV
jgi:hypothetical protein